MKKIGKIISIIILALVVFLGGNHAVKAVENTIQIGEARNVPEYISGMSFHDKRMANGEQLFCLHRQANLAQNVKATLQGKTSNGVTYIMTKSSITGDAKKDYYIKQVAVWWYLDDTTGSSNLSTSFRQKTGTMMNQIKALVKEAKSAGSPVKKASVNVTSNNFKMSLQDGYYISDIINVTATDSFKVVLHEGPRSYQVVDKDGNPKSKFSAKDSFRIKVPAAANFKNGSKIKIKISTTASYYQGYKYNPTDTKMQKVARLVKETTDASTVVTLTASSSVVKIYKLDKSTNQSIAGATLVLRDWKNNIVTSWTSSTDAHVIENLANGTYTVEETAAPDGYKLSTDKYEFTITDSQKDATIKVYNEAKESVVTIMKVDKETNAPLAGALIVVKDASGNQVDSFTSTTSAHVIKNLKDGTYTIEEIQAPAGYMRNENVAQITIDDNHLSHQVTIENYKEVIVPDTASASTIILTILGMFITIVGVKYIKNNANA